jgi:hypothetical protein
LSCSGKIPAGISFYQLLAHICSLDVPAGCVRKLLQKLLFKLLKNCSPFHPPWGLRCREDGGWGSHPPHPHFLPPPPFEAGEGRVGFGSEGGVMGGIWLGDLSVELRWAKGGGDICVCCVQIFMFRRTRVERGERWGSLVRRLLRVEVWAEQLVWRVKGGDLHRQIAPPILLFRSAPLPRSVCVRFPPTHHLSLPSSLEPMPQFIRVWLSPHPCHD